MSRVMMSLALALSLIAFSSVGSVQAFTWRIGPAQTTDATFNDLLGPRRDIPTPTFFRIVIDDLTGTAVLEEPYIQPLIRTLDPQLEKELKPSFPVKPQTERKVSRTQPHQLVGVEALLLRNAETVVLRPQP